MPDVRGAVATALPDYRVESVALLGEGTENIAFEINGELIVRFGRAPDPERTDREARLLAVVRGLASLPVPEPVFVLPLLGCLAYRRLPGTPLLDVPRPGRPERIATVLGAFLASLHAVAPGRLAGLLEVDDDPPAEWLRAAAADYETVADHLPAGCRGRVEAFLGSAPPPDGSTPVFSHNDLGIEHVLVDPDTSAVTGVIDWGDAALVDPAHDYGRLFRDLGPAALLPGVAGAGGENGAALRERAVFYARCGMLEDLAYGVGTGRRRYADKSLAALAWLFPA
ncbi:phosphotransferase family protein [Actinoplanes regularis]|uniref:phosphotransferase family protein n=1 Tax=Actinoplanes regularis TaxID=52697 RepID=UPI0024A36153|nr:aminoglycoside phosphotransferase family protein [Actinoplanes regularis]GLW31000.1 hypothetical protein Areg01_39400 [Actinoplanes regularis]